MSPREAVTDLLAALNAHDLDGVTARLAGQITVEIPPMSVHGGGRGEAKNFFANLLNAFPDLRVTIKRLVVIGDAVTVEVKVEGTQAAAYAGAINQEKHLDVDEAWRFDIRDGLVVGLEAYWCHQQMLRRLGVKRFDQLALV